MRRIEGKIDRLADRSGALVCLAHNPDRDACNCCVCANRHARPIPESPWPPHGACSSLLVI